eukprot:517767_1
MPTSLRGNSYYQYFSEKHSHSSSICMDPQKKYNALNRQYYSLKVYLMLMFKIILITLGIKYISRGLFMTALAWNKTFYYKYYLWIPNILIAVCIPQSILAFYLIIVMYSRKRYRIKIIIIHLLTTCPLIAIGIYFGIQWHKHHNLPPIIYPANDISIDYSNAYEASVYIYYLPINISTTLILLFAFSAYENIMHKYKASQTKNYIELDIIPSISKYNYRSLSMPLITDLEESDSFDYDSNINIDFKKHILMWSLLILFILTVYYIQYFFKDFDSHYSALHYEEVVRYWILFCIFGKFILKYIGHEFDTMRITVREIRIKQQSISDKNDIERDCDVSLEVLVEIWLSLSYWTLLRYYLVVYPNPDFRLFIIAKLTHIVSELLTCCRMSKLYYDYSTQFVIWIKEKTWYKILNKGCFMAIFYIGDDDCNYNQWFNRCSIDIGVRFIVAIVTSLYVYEGLTLLFWFHETFGYTTEQYIRATYYTIVSVAIEIVFYFVLYFLYKRYDINIFESFCVLYYKCGRRRIYAMVFFAIICFYSYV